MVKYVCSSIMICFLLLAVPYVQGEQLQDPMQLIQSSNNRILSIYQGSKHIDRQVQQKIFKIMEEVTDFAAMGQKATDGFCGGNSKEMCSEFQNTFIELLKLNGLRKLGMYRADRFDYTGKEIKGDIVIVKTIAHYKDDSMQLNYVLEKRDDGWRVVDYIADEVDTIRNYRQQFHRILERYSLADLVARLKDKVKEYRQEASQ